MGFLKIFAIFSIVGDWYKKAMADDVVTLAEGAELLIKLADVIGLKIDPEVVALVTDVTTDVLDAVEDAVEQVKDVVDVLEHDT